MKLLLALAAWSAAGGLAADAADECRTRTDALLAPLAEARAPGMAVLVQRDGRRTFARGYGAADLRRFPKIDAATDFRLASCTKQFTAAAIMLLAHDGKLRYDARLTDFFPDFPAYGRAISVRDLLHHTSGLPDYEDLMEESAKAGGAAWTPTRQIRDEEVLSLIERTTHPKFAAGESWAYSNSGYVLLGLIVAKVSGEAFPQFLETRIFAPLGMRRTLALVEGSRPAPHRAYGYTRRGDDFFETDQSATSATLGDGGVYSNLSDLAKWDRALAAHTLLSEPEMQAALVPARLADGEEPRWPASAGEDNLAPGKAVAYGFGWFLDAYAGRARMWHTGTTAGFRTAIERFTAERLTVIVLCNRTDLKADEIALKVAALWGGAR